VTDTFTVIDQTDEFLVIAKAPNVSFHSESGIGLFEQVKQAHDLRELYPVHRLDKMTSGLVLFAKTQAAAKALGSEFEHKKIKKYYLAISMRKPKKKQGLIKGDMATARNGNYKLLKTQDNPAVTQFFSYSIGEGRRLFILKPHTGKTHQLRVMMKSISAPILGDDRYGSDTANRGHLHAFEITFSLFNKQYRYQSSEYLMIDINLLEEGVIQKILNPDALPWPKV